MGAYKSIIKYCQVECDKMNLHFAGIGSLNDLNLKKGISYPCLWLHTPGSSSILTRQNRIAVQVFNINILFLQSGKIETPQNLIDDYFDRTNELLLSFVYRATNNDMPESIDSITFGNISQINKKQDNVHYGWSLSTSFNTISNIECCDV